MAPGPGSRRRGDPAATRTPCPTPSGRRLLHSGGWKRYSSRQQLTHPLQGVWGDIILQGEALAEFWAFLYLGQWLQVGKHANMGMGRYRLENANPSTFLQAHIP